MNFRKAFTLLVFMTVIAGCICGNKSLIRNKNNKNLYKNSTKSKNHKKKVIEKIVGGLNVKIEDFPYMMYFDSGMATQCGATIISQTLGITSAICCFKDTFSRWSLRIGSDNKQKGGKVIKVKKYLTHPRYGERVKLNYNFCLLWFAERLNFSTKVAPVDITPFKKQYQDQCVVLGFGEKVKGYYQDFLRAAVVELMAFETCYKTISDHSPNDYPLTDAQVCATSRNGKRGFCWGDSGGPLIDAAEGDLIGIVSHSIGPCSNAVYPGIYSRIATVIDWIKKNILENP